MKRGGNIIIGALAIVLASTWLVLSFVTYSSHTTRLTHLSIESQHARLAALAGVDYGLQQVIDRLRASPSAAPDPGIVSQLQALPPPPAYPGAEYTTPGGMNSFRVRMETRVRDHGVVHEVTILCGARRQPSGTGAVYQQRFRIRPGTNWSIEPFPAQLVEWNALEQ